MISNPVRWIALRRLRARAQSLSGPTVVFLEAELQAWREFGKISRMTYLRSELNSWIKRLQKALKAIHDASADYMLEQGTDWLQKKIRQGDEVAHSSSQARAVHADLRERIAKVDAEIRLINNSSDTLPTGAAKENRETIMAIRSLLSQIQYENHQKEFHAGLRKLEDEIQQHTRWLSEMEATRVQLEHSRVQLELLMSSTAWTSTNSSAEDTEQAKRYLNVATSAWNAGTWPRAAQFIKETTNCIENAKKSCDRAWNQGQDEIQMWKGFLAKSESFPLMKHAVETIPPELPPQELQKWIDYRIEGEREIDAAAANMAELFAKLPFRSVPRLNWNESDSEIRREYAKAVISTCKETITLLNKRHQKRRKRYKTASL